MRVPVERLLTTPEKPMNRSSLTLRGRRVFWLLPLAAGLLATVVVACGSDEDNGGQATDGNDSGVSADTGRKPAEDSGGGDDDDDDKDSGGTKDSGTGDSGTKDAGDGGSKDAGLDGRVADASEGGTTTCTNYLGVDAGGAACMEGKACYLGASDGGIAGYCHAPGSVPAGGACSFSSDCTPSGVCLNPGTCFALCAYPGGACGSGKTCADFGLPGLGYCVSE